MDDELLDELEIEVNPDEEVEIEVTVEAWLPDDMDLSVFDHGDLSWQDSALCRQVGADIFFPKQGSSQAARKVCAECEVRTNCEEYALSLRPQPMGIWAGLSKNQRDKIIRARKSEDQSDAA